MTNVCVLYCELSAVAAMAITAGLSWVANRPKGRQIENLKWLLNQEQQALKIQTGKLEDLQVSCAAMTSERNALDGEIDQLKRELESSEQTRQQQAHANYKAIEDLRAELVEANSLVGELKQQIEAMRLWQ